MVQRYDILKRDMVKSDDGNMVLYPDYADLEQRFNALSAKFTVMVEENATLRKRLEPIEEWWDRNCSEYIRKKHQKWDASMYEAIDKAMELIDPLYCPKCGACGEEGCCSPDRCIELPCLYGEHYLKSYKELEAENVILRKRREEMEQKEG